MDVVSAQGTKVRYKTTKSGLDIHIEVYPPSRKAPVPSPNPTRDSPVFLYFHGGALGFGNRTCFTPAWLHERMTDLGYLFVSADYRLLPSSTGHDILEDIQDLWAFITDPALAFDLPDPIALDDDISTGFKVDRERIAVGGTSAGGYCAYLAAMHCTNPKPKAILGIYSMGGDIFTSCYLAPKSTKFLLAPKFFDAAEHAGLLYPFQDGLFPEEAADSPLVSLPDGTQAPNARFDSAWIHLQLGVWLDALTGDFAPSLSGALRRICGLEDVIVSPLEPTKRVTDAERAEAAAAVPSRHRSLFPQLADASTLSGWPATFLLHGTADTTVSILESENLATLLGASGVEVEFVRVEGQEHNFDFAVDARERWGREMDALVEFMHRHTVISES